jgi:trigger factor
MDPIEVEVQKPMQWSRILKIRVSPELIDEEREKVVRSLRKKARIPGFRDGKAPTELILRHYKRKIESETIKQAINLGVERAIEKESLDPITRAAIDKIRYEDDKSLEFEASFDIRPEIGITRYKAFNLKAEKPVIDDEEVESSIQDLLERQSVYHVVDRAAEGGDLVNIDYTPIDRTDKPMEKQKVAGVKVILGENKILPDIEKELYGKAAGEEFITRIEYPEDYHREELRGKKRGFRISINSVSQKQVPELDMRFIQSLGDYSSLQSFRRHVREEILRQKKRECDRRLEEQLIDNIIEANPFEVPVSMINAYMSGIIKDFTGPDPSEEELTKIDEKVRPIAEREVKKGFIIDYIAKEEGLEPSKDDVNKEIEYLAADMGKNHEKFKAPITPDTRYYNDIRRRLTRERVFEFLVKNSEIDTN